MRVLLAMIAIHLLPGSFAPTQPPPDPFITIATLSGGIIEAEVDPETVDQFEGEAARIHFPQVVFQGSYQPLDPGLDCSLTLDGLVGSGSSLWDWFECNCGGLGWQFSPGASFACNTAESSILQGSVAGFDLYWDFQSCFCTVFSSIPFAVTEGTFFDSYGGEGAIVGRVLVTLNTNVLPEDRERGIIAYAAGTLEIDPATSTKLHSWGFIKQSRGD